MEIDIIARSLNFYVADWVLDRRSIVASHWTDVMLGDYFAIEVS
jgi:hypothetical protein